MVLAVRINFRSLRFFITGFCTSDRGWYPLCVHLLSLITVFFLGYREFFFSVWMASGTLRSLDGFQVASGWLMRIPLGLCVLASG